MPDVGELDQLLIALARTGMLEVEGEVVRIGALKAELRNFSKRMLELLLLVMDNEEVGQEFGAIATGSRVSIN